MTEGRPGWIPAAFRRLVEDTPARVSVVRIEGDDVVFELAGRSAAEGLGADPEELVGRTFRDIYPPEAAADVRRHVETARDAGHHTYETIRDLPGGRQSVHVDVLPIGEDRFVLSSLDISAERRAEERLDEVTRMACIGLYHWNVVDDEVWWSDELFRILGHEPGELEPTVDRFLERVHPDDRSASAARTELARRQETPDTDRYRIVTPAGEVRVVEARSEPFTAADGALVYVVGTVQDITDRIALERDAELFRAASARRRTALEVHDRIVQGLSAVWLALELGDVERAREATERATASAQEVVAEILAEVGHAHGGVRPGDLVHAPRPGPADG